MDFKLSVSKTKTFLDCNKKYDFQYNLKIPSKTFDYHTLGKLIHATLEHFHLHYMNGGNDPLNIAMKSAYRKAIKELSRAEVRNYFIKYYKEEYLTPVIDDIINDVYNMSTPLCTDLQFDPKSDTDYPFYLNWRNSNKIKVCDRLAFMRFKYVHALKEEIKKECHSLAANYLINYAKLTEKPEIIGCEKPFNITIPTDFDVNIILNGAIDRIQIDPDGVYHICDYKTTKNISYLGKDFFQLLAYAYIVYAENPNAGIKKIRGSYICLKHNCVFLTKEFDINEIKSIPDYFIKNTKKIVETKEWEPNPTKLCDYCSYCDICPHAYNKQNYFW